MIDVNNPGNIRYNQNIKWRGLADPPFVDHGTGPFCSFTDPVYGLRAMMIIISGYQSKHGVNDIIDLIHVWAPPSDGNPDENYIAYVSKESGFADSELICLTDENVLIPIVKAMVKFENGASNVTYMDSLYTQAAQLALS